jgi:hypothetical protein
LGIALPRCLKDLPHNSIKRIDGVKAMDSKDRPSPAAVLVLAGAVVYIVGRFFIEGNKGLVIFVIGFCILTCGFVMWIRKFFKK